MAIRSPELAEIEPVGARTIQPADSAGRDQVLHHEEEVLMDQMSDHQGDIGARGRAPARQPCPTSMVNTPSGSRSETFAEPAGAPGSIHRVEHVDSRCVELVEGPHLVCDQHDDQVVAATDDLLGGDGLPLT